MNDDSPPSPARPQPDAVPVPGTGGSPPAGGLADIAAGLLVAEDQRAPASAGSAAGSPHQQEQQPAVADRDLPGVKGRRIGLAAAVGSGGAGLVGALCALNLLDHAERTVIIVLGPDIQRSLGFSDAALGGIVGLSAVVLTLGAIPIGLLADRRRRTVLAAAAATVAGVFSALSALVTSTFQLVLTRIGSGFGQAAVLPVHNSLLTDGYPLNSRASVLGAHNLAGPVGVLIAPVAAGGVAALAGGSSGWRWAYAVFGFVLVAVGLLAFRLREPARGLGEREAVLGPEAARLAMEADLAASPGTQPAESAGGTGRGTSGRRAARRRRTGPPPVPLEAGVARLLKIRTLKYLFLGIGSLGFALVGVPTFFNALLDEHYGLTALERGYMGSITQVGVIVGVLAGGRLGDRLLRRSPPAVVKMLAACFAANGVLITVALAMEPLPLLVGLVTVAVIPLGMVTVPLYTFVAMVVPYRLRALGFAAVGVCVTLFGGFLGGILLGDISDHHGPRAAMLALAGPTALLAAALAAYGSRFARRDLGRIVEEITEERDELLRVAAGGDQPVLQVRNLDVSYGPVQVLFGVDLDVWPGEVLALLGTNGAGKSTLLRAITGLELPDRGVVRLAGRTITLDAPEQRVRAGIALVQGGKGIFGSMTVAENLLAGAHTFVTDRVLLEERAEEVLDRFPRLRERLHQRASTLSGGEQQMLALAKALLLRPSVLCVDELSLGLAPSVVAELVQIVGSLRETGVTVVLVEQSVNVAMAIADRAVFMEKGQIRFSGTPAELIERGDLVRAVFLGSQGRAGHGRAEQGRAEQ